MIEYDEVGDSYQELCCYEQQEFPQLQEENQRLQKELEQTKEMLNIAEEKLRIAIAAIEKVMREELSSNSNEHTILDKALAEIE
jgi:hypothetical protein